MKLCVTVSRRRKVSRMLKKAIGVHKAGDVEGAERLFMAAPVQPFSRLGLCGARTLKTPQAQPGSLYRCSRPRSSLRAACGPRREERGPEIS